MAIVFGSVLAACGSSSKENDPPDPGDATDLIANSATIQNSGIGAAVATRPSVRVTDADGQSVPGVEVTFEVASGGGSLTGAVQTTNAQGVATVGTWTTGPAAGANTLTASADGLDGSPITFTANASAVVSAFTIKLVYINPPTTAQQAAFDAAKARWEGVITGDLSNVAINQSACGIPINETVDDVLIHVLLDSIDGPSNVLGSAGPCLIRLSNSLTVTGRMTFDTADIASRINNGSFTDIVLHEMGHVLGIGSLWEDFDLLDNLCVGGATTIPTYNGALALAAYKGSNGGSGGATSVPVEDIGTGGGCNNGTYGSHWDEEDFKTELMTGFINGSTRPLSLTTIQSLADMGYTVNVNQADPFNKNSATLRASTGNDVFERMHDDVLKGPIYQIDDRPGSDGKITRVR